ARSEALQPMAQVRTSAQFSPIITTDPGASPVNAQAEPTAGGAQFLGLKFGKRTAIVVVACAVLFVTLLALAFILGRDEAIVEEDKQHKDVVKERAQSTGSPAPTQRLAPPAPIIITTPTATLNSSGEKVSDQKKAKSEDVGQKHTPPLQAHTSAQKSRKIL